LRTIVADLKIGHYGIRPKNAVPSRLRITKSDCATQKAPASEGGRYKGNDERLGNANGGWSAMSETEKKSLPSNA